MCRSKSLRPSLELAQVIRRFGPTFRASGKVCKPHLRTLDAIEKCRTTALGGYVEVCTACGSSRRRFNSCRNRHCPKCGGLEREAWIDARRQELLPVRYQHLVFTLPSELHPFCLYHPGFCYDLLFKAAWKTLNTFGRDSKWLGAKMGATMVLHTWGQNLSLHPHVHCILPTGGLDQKGRWVKPKRGGKSGFTFPVKAMSRVFKAIFLKAFMAAWHSGRLVAPPNAPQQKTIRNLWRRKLYAKDWIVFAKAPFGGPESVIEYLGRYTHKTAISNHRLIKIEEDRVFFKYKDYRQQAKNKVMSLAGTEFLRRFCLHILPPGFRRMRHYGILANFHKKKALVAARRSLNAQSPPAKLSRAERKQRILQKWMQRPLTDCPDCQAKNTRIRILLPPNCRAPPDGAPILRP